MVKGKTLRPFLQCSEKKKKKSKIASIFIFTSTLKIECGFKLIVLKISGKNPGPILDIKGKK